MEESNMADSNSKKEWNKPAVSPKILGLFSGLVHKDADKRVKSVMLLVHQIEASQDRHQDAGTLCRDTKYCLIRLVRGLASSRADAREGFFTGLVHLLRRVPCVSTSALLATASAQLADVRGDRRQGTEHRVGRLLAAGAAVRAGRTDVDLGPLTAGLLHVWPHRSYMPPMVATFVLELVRTVAEDRFQSEVWPELRHVLEPGWTGCVPERLWLLIVCRRRFPAVCDSRFLKQHWGSKKLFSPKNHAGFIDMIKACAGWLPVVHPLVPALAAAAVERPAAELVELHQHVLEPLLEDRTAALLVMDMLQMVVPHLNTPQLVESILSPALVGALVQLLPKRDQHTEQAARGLGSALVSRLLMPDSSPDVQLAILQRLVSPPGSVNFDFMTGTKILAQMINGLKPEALEPFAEIAIDAFNGTHADRGLTPRGRGVACDMLCRLVQHPNTPGLTPLKQRLLHLLFTAGVVQDDSVSDELAAAALRAFFRALDHPVRRLSDLTTLLRTLTSRQDVLLRSQGVVLRAPLTPAARVAWNAAVAALVRLESSDGPDTDVFVILLSHLSQQLFTAADSQTAIDTLQELHTCLERQQRKARGRRRPAADGDPEWSEVVTDLLLLLLSLNVHLLRSVVRSVFTLLAPQLSREAVLHVFQSLDPRYSMGGEQQEDEDDGSDEEGTEDDDEEESGDDDEDDEGDEDSEVDGDEAAEKDEGEDDQLETMRSQVKSALGDDSDDDGSIDMDDVPEEHFAKMDAALAAAFRAMRKDRRSKRGGRQSDEEQALMHFRVRVLDLADVYVRACPRSAAALDLLPVLVSLLSATATDRQQTPLVSRLRGCLLRLTSAGARPPDGHQLTPSLLAELLQEVLRTGARLPSISLELGGLLSAAVRFLVRTSSQLEADQTPVVDALKSALHRFFTDRECVYPQRLFAQLLQLPAWPHGWRLVPPLLAAAFDDDVRLYRRTQALQLLTNAARNAALVAHAAADDVLLAAAELWRRLDKLLHGVSSGDTVKTKYLCSSLEALLSLRQAAARLGRSVEPDAGQVAAALQRFVDRVPVGRPLRRLVQQLGARRTTPIGGGQAAVQKTVTRPADTPVSPAAETARRKRHRRQPPAADAKAAAEAERDGSVDSGVAEIVSDQEAPLAPAPASKTKRLKGGGASKPAKKMRP